MLLIELFAEREGFEPPVPLGTTVFKTVVIDHSTISPCLRRCKGKHFCEKAKMECSFLVFPSLLCFRGCVVAARGFLFRSAS